MNTNTDQELLVRHVRAHDPAALRELLARHAPMVYATARRLAPSDAEDVTQAVFLLLWQKAAKLERGKPISVGPLKVALRELRKTDRDWSVTVDITGTGRDRLAYAIAPVVVTKKGWQVGPESNMSEYSYYRDPTREPDGKEPLTLRFSQRQEPPLEQDEFDHLELLWRKVEIVTFEGFATAPAGVEMADIEKAGFNRDFASARTQEMAQVGLPQVAKITDKLNAGTIATADQLRQAFEAMVKDLQKTETQ